jgi:hypothetical protein
MTIARKDIRGNWKAEDSITLPDNQILKVSTHKVSNGSLVTSAMVGRQEGMFFSHMMWDDFNRSLIISRPAKCTSKAVETQHGAAMKDIEQVKKDVTAFYAAKVPT